MSDSAFSAWIGRTEQAHDQLSRNLVKRIAATLGDDTPAHGEALPPLWHWAFFQEPIAESGLGGDGHPARGGFLPPADNRNRMWAGGRIEFIAPLRVGGEATRLSTIKHIEEKHGRTGALLFVTVQHDYLQDGELAIREEQDIVYREPSPPKGGAGEALPAGDWREGVVPSPTLLFRYSAVTFNGHRIHYDWPYVTGTALGWARLAVDDVLLLADRQFAVLQVVVLHGDEQQRAGAPVLFLDVLDGRDPSGLAADPQGRNELDAPTGPHAIAVVRRWQEAAACRVPVAAQAALGDGLLEECPMPERR